MVSGDDLTALTKDMQRRRAASKPPNKISQSAIADMLDVSQGTISKWENGTRSLRKVSGRDLYVLLRGYGYSALEIKAAVEKFDLQLPPQLVEEHSPAPGTVTVLYEGSISTRRPPEPRQVYDVTRGRFDPDETRFRIAEPADLTTAAAQRELSVDAEVRLHKGLPPVDGMPAIIKQDDTEAFCIWPFAASEYVMPLDPKSGAEPVLFDPERIEVVARVLYVTKPYI